MVTLLEILDAHPLKNYAMHIHVAPIRGAMDGIAFAIMPLPLHEILIVFIVNDGELALR